MASPALCRSGSGGDLAFSLGPAPLREGASPGSESEEGGSSTGGEGGLGHGRVEVRALPVPWLLAEGDGMRGGVRVGRAAGARAFLLFSSFWISLPHWPPAHAKMEAWVWEHAATSEFSRDLM